MDYFLSILLGQDVPNFHNIAQVEESCPRDLFYMWVKWHVLVKQNSKAPNSRAGSQAYTIQGDYLVRQSFFEVFRANSNDLSFFWI